jgi:DNA-binding CsgD family transcriptional regulator
MLCPLGAHACIELLARAGDDRERVSPRERLIDRPSPSLDRIYQLGLWSAIFFAIFLRLPPNKSPDSAGPFTSFDPVGFAIFATHARGAWPRNSGGLAARDREHAQSLLRAPSGNASLVVRLSANQVTEALSGFRSVLNVSAPAGIYQTILDEGPRVGDLLTAFQENAERRGNSGKLMPYVATLIAGWRLRYQSQVEPAPRSATAEALSAREGDILKLIAQGLSNKEIARTLTITPETVKSHVKHIFIKMGVEKRAQAVSRAQSLGLVSTH